MKKAFSILACSLLLLACGKGKNGKTSGEEVCACFAKANAMDPADPNRAKAQSDCSKKQFEAWSRVKDDAEQSAAFNQALSSCATEQIRKSFGK